MTKFKKTNKLPMNVILVASGDQGLPTGDLVTSGVNLNLANQQIGVLSWDPDSATRPLGEFIAAADTSSAVQAIKIVQGTPASSNVTTADIWEARDKGYVESGIIRKENIRSVAVKLPKFGRNGAQAITNVSAPIDDLQYRAYLRLQSVRNDRYYGDNDEVVHASVPVVNFTALGTVDPLDYVLQNLAADFNKQSKLINLGNSAFAKGNRNFIVLGVNIAGGAGTVIGTSAVGDSVDFMTNGGVTSSVILTEAMVASLAVLVDGNADLLATSTIEVIDTSTAGAAATVDALIVLGLDHSMAVAYDSIEQVRTRVELQLADGFKVSGATETVTTVFPEESVNTGAKWYNFWRQRAGLNVHTKQVQPQGDFFIEGKSYIDSNKLYTSYEIEFYNTEDVLDGTKVSPHTVTILFPAEVDSLFANTVNAVIVNVAGSAPDFDIFTSDDSGTGTASANDVTDIEAALTVWLEDVRTNGNPFRVVGDATAGGAYLS